MNRNIVIGLAAIAIIAGIVYWYQKTRTPELPFAPEPTFQETFENKFNVQIPDDVEKAELSDVSGGDGSGLATRKYEGGIFSHNVLADLADPDAGYFYEGWLVRGKSGDSDFAYISTGRLNLAKGGYILEYQSSKDYSDYEGVVVTLEKVNDKTPEKHILEGSF